jgi:type III pantothenate kinase
VNLIADIGNTRVKLFVIDGFEIAYTSFYKTLNDADGLFKRFPNLENGIYCASGREPDELINCLNVRLKKLVRFTAALPLPVGNLYKTPETLGNDRIAAAIGVNHFFPDTDTMLFDFGTAITIDFIDKRNNFVGGNISPGLSTRFKALNSFTGKLPLLSAEENFVALGSTTREAIIAGVINGIIGEIKHYVQQYPNCKVIFTGGDACFFAKHLQIPIYVFCNPVAYGLQKVLLQMFK